MVQPNYSSCAIGPRAALNFTSLACLAQEGDLNLFYQVQRIQGIHQLASRQHAVQCNVLQHENWNFF